MKYLDNFRWESFRNTSSETIPAWAIVAITGVEMIGGDRKRPRLLGAKPSATLYPRYVVNGPGAVPAGKPGKCTSGPGPVWVAYDTGTPTANSPWGPKSGQWTISTGCLGIARATGQVRASDKIALIELPNHNWIFPVTLGSSVTDGGTAASVSLPDGRTVSAVNKSGMTLTAGNATVYQSLHDGAWYLTGARSSGGGGGGGSRFFEAELDGDLCSTDATTFVTNAVAIDGLGSEPSDPEVLNDFTEWGSSGDKCLIVESPGLEISYLLVRVEHAQPDELLPGTLSGTLALTDSTASVVVDGDTVTATNSLSLAGPNGAYCEVLKTGCGDDLEYRLINVKHYDCES